MAKTTSRARLQCVVVRTPFNQMAVGSDHWDEFMDIVRKLGHNVRVTGGIDKTHDIDCSMPDLRSIISMAHNAGGEA